MLKTALVASLMLAGSPALAQATQPATPAQPAAPATPAQPATSVATDPMTAPTTTAPAADTAATPATETAAAANTDPVAATVEADWAKYDKNGDGKLSRVEFDTWYNALQTAAGKKAESKSYLAAAFAKVDTNKNKSVSKDELTKFLKG